MRSKLAPWPAFYNSFHGKESTPDNTVLLNRLDRIRRAARVETADTHTGKHFARQTVIKREKELVHFNQCYD